MSVGSSRVALDERRFIRQLVQQEFRIEGTRNGKQAWAPDGVHRIQWHSSIFDRPTGSRSYRNFQHQCERAGFIWPWSNGKEKQMSQATAERPLSDMAARLLQEVAQEPGLAPKEYAARMGVASSKQLRWATVALIKEGRIRAEGATKARRLFIGGGPTLIREEEPVAETPEEEVPVEPSPEEPRTPEPQAESDIVVAVERAMERYRAAMDEIIGAMAELDSLIRPFADDYARLRVREQMLTERIEALVEVV